MSVSTGGPPGPLPSLPRYGEASLADLLPSTLAALDVPGTRNPLLLEPTSRACLLVVDGLGWELLQENRAMAPFLSGMLAEAGSVLTACFPSTTAVSLASIGTGLPPGEHGLVGYTMSLPDHGQVLNLLRWATYGVGGGKDLREAVQPERLQPEPTLFERAAADGVEVTLVGPADHARSGLTRAALRGGRYQGTCSVGDQIAQVLRALGAGRRSLVYAYYADLDITGHVRGTTSEMWRLQLAVVDRLVELLAERLPRGALLLVTGDHGMLDLRPEDRIDLADHPELASGVHTLAGEARARHVHTLPGAAADVLATWRAQLGHAFWVASREEAVEAGWFGPRVPRHVRERIGDVVAAAHAPTGIFQRDVDPAQGRMVGHHGSMTATEQLVPLLTVRR